MYAGIAGALLVFTGIWHATEWLMDGRRPDTWRLVPVGLVYAALGVLLVLSVGGVTTQVIAALAAATGGTAAFLLRKQLDVRPWVTWTFIGIDVVVVLTLLAAIFG